MIFRRTWFRVSLLAGLCFLLGFSWDYHLPKIESFLLIEFERLSREHSPVRVWAKKLHIHLLPLGIVLEDVRVLPKAPLDRYLAPATLRQVGARLSLLPLLRGELRLGQVFVRDSELNVFLRPELFEKKPGAKPFDFDQVYRLPIDELSLERVQLQGRVEPQNVVFRARDLNLLVENRYRSLFVELEAPNTLIKPSGPVRALESQLELRTLVEAHEAQVSAFKLKSGESFVVASGRLNGDFAKGRLDNGALDARARVQLPDVNVWEKVFYVAPKLPPLIGRADVNVGFEVRGGRGYQVQSDVRTKAVQVGKYKIGDVETRVSVDLGAETRLASERVDWQSDAGRVQVKNLKVALGAQPTAEGHVSIPKLEVGRLLENLAVHDVPIVIDTDGEADCKATLGAKPVAICTGGLNVEHLLVRGKESHEVIVEANAMRSRGEVKVTDAQVEYAATAEVGAKTRGRSSGVISYEDGFKINYEGEHVDFGDVKNLANLKIAGEAKITGSTTGTAKWATIDLTAQGRGVWLEDYPFGQVTSHVTYKAGHLGFQRVVGATGTTQYAGDVDLHLPAHRIKLKLDVPYADLRDVESLFQRKVQLPFSASGTGQAHLEAEGPLRLRDLSYRLRSSFYRGDIAGENFDEIAFDVTSRDGFVKSDRLLLTKASGRADARGTVTPKGDVDVSLSARGLRLEQSENVAKLGLDVQGQGDFDLRVIGQLPHPRIDLNGRLTKMIVSDQTAADSTFRLGFMSDRLEGQGEFLGGTLATEVTLPYEADGPFKLKVKANHWDFSTLFTAVSRSARQLDYQTSLTGDINLNAPRGGFWGSTGELRLSEFSLSKGAKRLANPKPMRLMINEGEINSADFAIEGEDGTLKLDVVGLRRERLNASLNGKIDLSLLGLFTPFITDLRGTLAVSMDLRGRYDKPLSSGSAYVEKGYAKLRDFPHPFAAVRADVLFNDNTVVLNSLRSELAGGRLNLAGHLRFEGKQRPLDVHGDFNDVTFNVPDGFKTSGSGSISLSGKSFPYVLGVTYNVTGGEVTSEFTEAPSGTATVKASTYLPKFVAQDTFHPLTFDLDVRVKKPIAVNNQLAQMQVQGAVNVTGTPDRPLLTGTLTPQPGSRVFFNNQPFEVTSAFVEYTGNPPPNPKIYVVANTRVSSIDEDSQGRTKETPYEVNLIAQGRGPVPQIILSSQPPLSQREIVSLLALGVTTAARDDKSNNSSAAIGAALLQKAGGKRIKETLGVDVKVSSTQQTADAASTPKVTLSKQWTPNFGASASSTLQANPSNDVQVEYKMNKSMSVIGSWEGRQYDLIQKDPVRNVFGVDLEYKKQFR